MFSNFVCVFILRFTPGSLFQRCQKNNLGFFFWFPLVLRGIGCLQGERSLFLESHKQCIYWLDEWCDLTFEDVRQLEVATDVALNQVGCINPPPNFSKFTKSGLFASTCYTNFES
jgi:hypothetical protein